MSDEIHQQQDFFDKVRLEEDGTLGTINVPKTGAETKAGTAKEFYERIALDENGNIKTFI